MNNINLIGRLVADPELRQTNNGLSVCNFTLAVQRDKQNADFIICQAWKAQAENLVKYQRKGGQIGVSGRLQTRKYEVNGQNRTAYEVIVNNVMFLDNRQEQSSQTAAEANYQRNQAPQNDFQQPMNNPFDGGYNSAINISDSDLPF